MAAPVLSTAAGDFRTAFAHGSTALWIDCLAPANTVVDDALVAYAASQNQAGALPITATGWDYPGTTRYSTVGDGTRRPQIFLVKFVTDTTTRDALLATATRFTSTNTNGGRWGVIIHRISGARLSDLSTWSTGAFSTGGGATSVNRTIPGVAVPQDESLVMVGASAQTTAGTAAPHSASFSSGWTKATELATISTGTAAHQVTTVGYRTAGTGTLADLTATWNQIPTSASGYVLVIPPAASTPPGPTATSMKDIAHRGTLASASDTTENHPDGIALLPAGVNGVELDARLSSDGVVHACHDETIDRTARNGDTGLVSAKTSAQLTAAGILTMSSLLEACVGKGFNDILVQSYTAAGNQTQMNAVLAVVTAARLRQRITVMTSISGPYHPELVRAGGWTGKLGVYGSTATNWAGSGAGKSADFTTHNITVAFLPPGAYTANRAHVATLIAAGVVAGASTENSSTQWAQAHADGTGLLLTDESTAYLALYTPPATLNDAWGGLTTGGVSLAGTGTSRQTATGALVVGGATLTGTVASSAPVRTNRATNPTAEVNSTGLYSNNGTTYPLVRSTTLPISGTASWMSTLASDQAAASSVYGNGVGTVSTLAVTPGQEISISLDIRTEADRTVTPTIVFRDGSGVIATLTSATAFNLDSGIVTRVGMTAVVPAGALYAYGGWTVNRRTGQPLCTAGERVWYDNILVEDGPLGLYFDGGTAGAAWTGTAHASTSVIYRNIAAGGLRAGGPTLSGSAAARHSATGTLTVGGASLVGSSTMRSTATGALATGGASLSGSTTARQSATGALGLGGTTVAGTVTSVAPDGPPQLLEGIAALGPVPYGLAALAAKILATAILQATPGATASVMPVQLATSTLAALIVASATVTPPPTATAILVASAPASSVITKGL